MRGGVKLGITGTFSTGKSTLLKALLERLSEHGIEAGVTHVGSIAERCPFPLNRDQTIPTTLWMLGEVMKQETEAAVRYPIVLCDRTVVDIWALGLYAAQRDRCREEDIELVTCIARAWARTYRRIFHASVDPSQEPDWPKVPDIEFRGLVDDLQRECLASLANVTPLPTDAEERTSMVMRAILTPVEE